MIYNYIPVAIGEYYKVTGPSISYQYDVKQYLVLTGVVLPEFFLVDFCNEGDTTTMPITGTGNTVEIPDACLLTGKRIKAYIVVSGLDAGASETRIEITLPVNRRPARTDITPTPAEQSTIDSLIEAMNMAVEDSGDAKTAAETAQGKAEDAQAASEAAAAEAEEAVGHYPKIENGTWWIWDAEEEAYVDTGVTAEGQPGQDGFSPIATVTQEGDVTTISITDKDGTTTADIDLGPIKEEVEELALSKADMIVDTAGPAAIANFPDGADNYPIRQMVATIEPVQDLHGYDNPWPAGGGANLFDIEKATLSGGSYGLVFTRNGDKITVSGTPNTTNHNANFACIQNYSTSELSGKGYVIQAMNVSGNTISNIWGFRTETERSIGIAMDLTEGVPVLSTFSISVAAALQSSYSPYKNICPISGWTGLSGQRTGKNLWKFDASYSPSGYAILINNNPFYLPVGTYTFSAIPNISSDSIVLFGYHADGTRTEIARLLYSTSRQSASRTLTKPVVSAYFASNSGGTISDIQLELGSTASTYEEYQGEPISVSWEDEAGTVFDGTIRIDGNGNVELTATKAHALLNDPDKWAEYSSSTGNFRYSDSFDDRKLYNNSFSGLSCSYMQVDTNKQGETARWAGSTSYIFGLDTRNIPGLTLEIVKADAQAGKIEILYELAEYITYNLASLDELPKVLKGVNNFWVNTGDTSVTYPADTKLYVDKKIAALAAALS